MAWNSTLRQRMPSEYAAWQRSWGDDRVLYGSLGFFEIEEPIVAKDAYSLVDRVREIPHAARLNVRDGPYWERFAVDAICDDDEQLIDHLVSSDSRKRNYLEIELRRGTSQGRDAAKIEFTERDGMLIGYKVYCPPASRDLFTLIGSPGLGAIKALASPSFAVRPGVPVETRVPLAYPRNLRTG